MKGSHSFKADPFAMVVTNLGQVWYEQMFMKKCRSACENKSHILIKLNLLLHQMLEGKAVLPQRLKKGDESKMRCEVMLRQFCQSSHVYHMCDRESATTFDKVNFNFFIFSLQPLASIQKAKVFPSPVYPSMHRALRDHGTENRQESCSKNRTEKTVLGDLRLLFSALPLAKL